MFSNIGPTTIILIVIVALLLFGPNKLPELGRALGRTLREFKSGAKDIMNDEEPAVRKEVSSSEVRRTDTEAGEDRKEESRKLPE